MTMPRTSRTSTPDLSQAYGRLRDLIRVVTATPSRAGELARNDTIEIMLMGDPGALDGIGPVAARTLHAAWREERPDLADAVLGNTSVTYRAELAHAGTLRPRELAACADAQATALASGLNPARLVNYTALARQPGCSEAHLSAVHATPGGTEARAALAHPQGARQQYRQLLQALDPAITPQVARTVVGALLASDDDGTVATLRAALLGNPAVPARLLQALALGGPHAAAARAALDRRGEPHWED